MLCLSKLIIDFIGSYLPFETQVQFAQVTPFIKKTILKLDQYYQGLYLQHTGLDKLPNSNNITVKAMYMKAKKYSCYYKEHLWVNTSIGIKTLGWCRSCKATFYNGKLTLNLPDV